MERLIINKKNYIQETDMLDIVDLWLYGRLKRNFRIVELKTMEREYPNKGGKYV